MFIRIFSDIHLEFGRNYRASEENFFVKELPTDKDTVLCLAGDVCSIKSNNYHISFFENLKGRFKDILYIPGNHEYYNGSITNMDEKLEEMCKEYGITFLQNKTKTIDNVNFIGATLWTNLRACEGLESYYISQLMNDYKKIRYGFKQNPYEKKFNIAEHQHIHDRHLKFITNSLAENTSEKCVVMTHHTPSLNSIHEYYRKQKANTNRAYYSDLDYLFYDYKIDLWLHGHTHATMDYTLNQTRVICNPVGYPGEPSGYLEHLIEL